MSELPSREEIDQIIDWIMEQKHLSSNWGSYRSILKLKIDPDAPLAKTMLGYRADILAEREKLRAMPYEQLLQEGARAYRQRQEIEAGFARLEQEESTAQHKLRTYFQSNGGKKTRENKRNELADRDQKIRKQYSELLGAESRNDAIGILAKRHSLSSKQIRRIVSKRE